MKPELLPVAAGPAGAEGLRAGIVDRAVDRCHAATVRYHTLVRRPGSDDRAAEARLGEALNAPPHTGCPIADLAETALASCKHHESERRIFRDESAEASRALAKAEPAVAALAWLAPPAVHDDDGSVPARTGP